MMPVGQYFNNRMRAQRCIR